MQKAVSRRLCYVSVLIKGEWHFSEVWLAPIFSPELLAGSLPAVHWKLLPSKCAQDGGLCHLSLLSQSSDPHKSPLYPAHSRGVSLPRAVAQHDPKRADFEVVTLR